MRHLRAILLIVALASPFVAMGYGYAQTTNPLPNFSVTEVLIIVGIGVFAGLLVAYQGFAKQTDPFSAKLFFDRVITCTVTALGLAIGQAVTYASPLTPLMYVMIFGAAIGFGELYLKSRSGTTPTPPASSQVR